MIRVGSAKDDVVFVISNQENLLDLLGLSFLIAAKTFSGVKFN